MSTIFTTHTLQKKIIQINNWKKKFTWGKAQQAYWSSFDWEVLQQVWLDGQTTSDDPHLLKISFSNEIVLFNWQAKCSSSQIYLYGQQVEPFEPQQTP